jgi:type I restriction enzyme S subunit
MIDGDWIETKDQDPSGEVRLVQLADIGDGVFLNKSSRFLTKAKAIELGCTFLKPGDVLIARMPDPLGRACIFPGVGRKAVTAVDVCIWRPGKGAANAEWLKYFINSPQVRDRIALLAGGTTRQRISGGNLKKLEVPTPPLRQQIRIATKLDALFKRSKNAREQLACVPRLVERYRNAILSAAFRGALTAEWRKTASQPPTSGEEIARVLFQAHSANGGHKVGNASPPTEGAHTLMKKEFPLTWGLAELRDLVEPSAPITYGILKPGPDCGGGIPYIRVADFPNDLLNVNGVRRTSAAIDADFKRSRLKAGDILLSIRGTVGRVCRIPELLDGANITQDSARVRLQKYVIPAYVEWMLRSPAAQSAMERAIKGVAVRGINIGDVRALQIPIPSVEEQREIVQRVEAVLDRINGSAVEAGRAMTLLDRLDHATLAKAFRGELLEEEVPAHGEVPDRASSIANVEVGFA